MAGTRIGEVEAAPIQWEPGLLPWG